jgi:hypothetical protein
MGLDSARMLVRKMGLSKYPSVDARERRIIAVLENFPPPQTRLCNKIEALTLTLPTNTIKTVQNGHSADIIRYTKFKFNPAEEMLTLAETRQRNLDTLPFQNYTLENARA